MAICMATAQAAARWSVVLLPDGSAEQNEDSVADELVDGALVLLDDRAPWRPK